MLIHLIRHTTPDIEPGICYGSSDIDLKSSFPNEREIVLSRLKNNYDAVFTSPLGRCAKLSDSINADSRFIDDRLKEYDFGDWELSPWSEINDGKARHWMDNYVSSPAPNGDSLLLMKKRVDDFWHELVKQNFSNVAIVTHAGVIRIIHGLILQTPLNRLFHLQLDYGSIVEIQKDINTGLETVKHI